MKRAMMRVLGTAAVAVLALSGSTVPAHAQDYFGALRNEWTDRCLDDSHGAGLRAHSCNYSNSQRWYATIFPDGRYELRNEHTDRCLDDSWTMYLRAIDCNRGADAQLWNLYRNDDGTFNLWNERTGKCLDDSWGAGLRAIDCTWHAAEEWRWL